MVFWRLTTPKTRDLYSFLAPKRCLHVQPHQHTTVITAWRALVELLGFRRHLLGC